MTILVAVASRHGSTDQIGEAIAEELRTAGHTVDVRTPEAVDDLTPYEAFVIGSAVYMGKWLPEAEDFVDRNQAKLAGLPVWLFSSGPLGHEDPKPYGDPAHLDHLMGETQAREHRIFVGKLDKSDLNLGERLTAKVVRAPEGDFRDWNAIRGWARQIAIALEYPVEVPV